MNIASTENPYRSGEQPDLPKPPKFQGIFSAAFLFSLKTIKDLTPNWRVITYVSIMCLVGALIVFLGLILPANLYPKDNFPWYGVLWVVLGLIASPVYIIYSLALASTNPMKKWLKNEPLSYDENGKIIF